MTHEVDGILLNGRHRPREALSLLAVEAVAIRHSQEALLELGASSCVVGWRLRQYRPHAGQGRNVIEGVRPYDELEVDEGNGDSFSENDVAEA